MKRCPECRRDYYDESLIFCLDDGARLLEGPTPDAMPTAIMPVVEPSRSSATRTFDNGAPTTESSTGAPLQGTRNVLILFAVVTAAVFLSWAAYTFYTGRQARQIESIAVMPFVNGASNPDLEYLSDGITESLINSLSQVPSLSVKARSSVFTYKGKDVTPQQVANDLSVQAVVNGRVRQRGDQVILNVELVDAATGNQIWGEQYARKIADLVQLQSEIARDVTGRLRAKLSGTEQQRVSKNYTENTEAYQLYLRGRYHWNKRKPDDIRKSIEYFQQAIDKDPTYALAYASMAESYILVPNYRLGPPKEYYPKARAAATRAIEIDQSLAEAHNALATVTSNYDWKFREAEAEFLKALELNPNYATAHQWYAEFLLSLGRNSEALSEIRRAQELDPLSLIINGMVGVTLWLMGENGPALEQLNKTLEMDPNFPRTHLFLAEVHESVGRFDEAADEFARHLVLNGGSPDGAAAFAQQIKSAARAGGPKGYSLKMAELLEANAGAVQPPVTVMAGYWGRGGEIDKAFSLLEKAYADRDDGLLTMKDRRLDPLKSDPRYKDLLRRVGLPE
ncbi:MAG TPA: tetratricopeptide repeat protein [Pyrinomonadaceae bacterium]|nr:tetratricopeptide repeat protein [Pyrinomonadaceae bacterium]